MLKVEEIKFIEEHLLEDVATLAFQKNKFPKLDLPKLLFQLQTRQKLKGKLPTWTSNSSVFFPPQLSLEQSSSEKTALFKAELINGKIIDLTGGMGLDTWAFAQKDSNEITYVEINESLKEITQYNHHILGLDKIKHVHADGMDYIFSTKNTYNWIYLDPARRDNGGKKVFLLRDCTPDATQILSRINKKTGLLLKVSPMLDIDLCIKELDGVDEVHIVTIQNEIKELLLKKTEKSTLDPMIFIWDLHSNKKLIFQLKKSKEKESSIPLSPPLNYLYEPHAGILKAGFFKSIASEGIMKISNNTHLYTSSNYIPQFPGKSFEIIGKGKLDKKWIESMISGNQLSISCRNFPLKPEEIRKKIKFKDGGDKTLFAFRNQLQQSEIVICQKT